MRPHDLTLTPIELLTREPGSDDNEEAIVTVHDSTLVKLSRAAALLAQAVREVDLTVPMELAAQARAVLAYKNVSLAAQADAAEILLRATIAEGQILESMPKETGGRPKTPSPKGHSSPPTESRGTIFMSDEPTYEERIEALGISRKHARLSRSTAKVPEQQREGYIKSAREGLYDKGGQVVSAAGLLRMAGHRLEKEPEPKKERLKFKIGECNGRCAFHCKGDK